MYVNQTSQVEGITFGVKPLLWQTFGQILVIDYCLCTTLISAWTSVFYHVAIFGFNLSEVRVCVCGYLVDLLTQT